jgi:hypothetical protein
VTDLPTLFYAPMRLFLARPYLALVPALAFAAGFRALRGRRGAGLLLSAAILWALYAAYETYMRHWSKTVVAPIRVDLLLLAPVLYAAVAAALMGWWRAARNRP